MYVIMWDEDECKGIEREFYNLKEAIDYRKGLIADPECYNVEMMVYDD